MNWSPTILRIGDIAIKMHVSFLLLIGFEAWRWREQGVTGMLFGVGLILLLFVCVVLHELGHALAAKSVGIPVREILLLPIGGLAFLTRLPRKPLHELWIAVAGPLVNVVILIALLPFAIGESLTYVLPGPEVTPSVKATISALYTANVMLVLFNMLPAFPLDGGRILRALLALFAGERTATNIATLIGQAVAVIIGVLGVLGGNILMVLTAAFIFLSAGNEKAETRTRTMLETKLVGDAYNRHALTLTPADRTSRVVDLILTSYQPDFAVMQGSQLLGIVTREDVMNSLAQEPNDVYVASIMQRNVLRVPHSLTLDEVRNVITAHEGQVAAVFRDQEYLGLISLTDIDEALAVIDYVERQKQLTTAT
ncbi:MAG: site-2 protease family protein [Chloroflexi bacterium]|nr:site-2 protease family protein [Chloroflexota bacterium]